MLFAPSEDCISLKLGVEASRTITSRQASEGAKRCNSHCVSCTTGSSHALGCQLHIRYAWVLRTAVPEEDSEKCLFLHFSFPRRRGSCGTGTGFGQRLSIAIYDCDTITSD